MGRDGGGSDGALKGGGAWEALRRVRAVELRVARVQEQQRAQDVRIAHAEVLRAAATASVLMRQAENELAATEALASDRLRAIGVVAEAGQASDAANRCLEEAAASRVRAEKALDVIDARIRTQRRDAEARSLSRELEEIILADRGGDAAPGAFASGQEG